MLLNHGKCKCLHTGHGRYCSAYYCKIIGFGVTISGDMNVSQQSGIVASKDNRIIGLIRRNITYKEKKLIIPLYKSIVRPHLEDCI